MTAIYRRRLRMDRVALFVAPPAVAETVTEVLDELGDVVTMNVAELLPGATVTLAGTLATEGLLLDSATTVPPAGAAPLRVTVPVEELPAFTVEGESVNDDSTGGLRVRAVVLVMPA